MTRKNSLIGTGALCGAAALAGLAFFPLEKWRGPLLLGLGVALALALPSYWSLCWAMQRSDKVFYSVYAGGALGRLAGLFLTALAVWRAGVLPIVPVLLSLAGSLSALSMIEVYFLKRQAEAT